mmetsp:Transcript_90199/g.291594  ORF Transcript_90199/g.291594 Transcript_90199/m.291594 type:complete len:584 (+) Transcript_90199:239-1990(+)
MPPRPSARDMPSARDLPMGSPLNTMKRGMYDLMPLTSPRFQSKGKRAGWEWQCDHEDEGRMPLPELPETAPHMRTINENDRLAELWVAGMDEVPVGPFAFTERLWFQSAVGVVIAMNAIIIGIETDRPGPGWASVENSLLLFFVMELSLRLAHKGCPFFFSFGNLFDVVIVCSGVFDMWFVPLVNFITGREENSRSAIMSVIQMLRLLRIIRLIRLVKIVQPLYRLALGIAEAIQGMFWVLVFLAMMLYAVAILLTRLVGRNMDGERIESVHSDREETCSGGCSLTALDVPPEEIRSLFNSVLSSMFVLFESMSCWSLMRFTPLFDRMPLMKLGGVLFYIFTAWALLAVMTGVVSEKMIAAGEKRNIETESRHQEQQFMATQALLELFEKADADGSGSISKEEFNNMLMWTDVTKSLMDSSAVNAQDLHELFDWLDHDKDGVVTVTEFQSGFAWLTDDITPKSFLKLQEEVSSDLLLIENKLVDFINTRFDTLTSSVVQPLRKIHALTEQIQRLDVQVCTRSRLSEHEDTLDGVSKELMRRGPQTRASLLSLEDRVGRRLDKLLDLVEQLDRLRSQGLVRLKV